jgi:putative transposase
MTTPQIVEAIAAICDEFEFYGWRRVRAELQYRGIIVNHKKIRRLMREHDLEPRRWRRYVATTDSDHDQPIYPNRTRELTVDGPNRLWVADITYVPIAELRLCRRDPRRLVASGGWLCNQPLDRRPPDACGAYYNAAIERRKPPPGCVHHTDRSPQYAAHG